MTPFNHFSRLASAFIASLAVPMGAYPQDLDRMMQTERQDLGVPPSQQLHAGPMHGPTPASIPGGQVITTKGLLALYQGRQVPFLVFDVLGQPEALPNALPAAWLAQPGSFSDGVQQQAAQALAQQTQGRKDVALVFYCLSRECWMSYNAALRSIRAGYTNVLWYRGGIEAWKYAGLPTQQGAMAGQQMPNQVPPQMPPQMMPPMQTMPGQMPGPMSPQTSQQMPQPMAAQGQQPHRSQLPFAAVPAMSAAFVPVSAVTRGSPAAANNAPPAGELRIGQTRFFSFALPPGWRIGEDGQFALTLLSPDSTALTIMVGNAGFPIHYAAGQFAHDKLLQMQVQNLQMSPPRQARPAAGFQQAAEFDISYFSRGMAYRGIAKVSVTPAYDTQTMAMTAAVAPADQWAGYAGWLPQVADQVAATNGGAFGMRGLMQQNLQNSVAFGEAARQYRDWSQKNWQQVTDDRNASVDRRNFAVRENLGGVQTFANPFGTQQRVELPTTHKYYWRDRQGNMVGTNDPGANPNNGGTGEWRRMERVGG